MDLTNQDSENEGKLRLREAVKAQLGTDNPSIGSDIIENLVLFSPSLPKSYSPKEKEALEAQIEEMHPWLQGPFYLGGDLVISGAWHINLRWVFLGPEVPENLAGKRVLDVGCNAGYDCFSFNLRNPAYTLGIDPEEIFFNQDNFLNGIYKTPVKFENTGWQNLSPEKHGLFDLVHCNGVYYHEKNYLALIEKLAEVTRPGGILYLGGFVLADRALDDYARFVSGSFWNDPTWWWVPGTNCLATGAEASGFQFIKEFGRWHVPNGEFPVDTIYLKLQKK